MTTSSPKKKQWIPEKKTIFIMMITDVMSWSMTDIYDDDDDDMDHFIIDPHTHTSYNMVLNFIHFDTNN